MKLIINFCNFLAFTIATVLIAGCFNKNLTKTEVKKEQQKHTFVKEVPKVKSLCDLLHDRDLYNKKRVMVRTLLYKIKAFTTFLGKECSFRHHVIDVTFSSKYASRVCRLKNDKEGKICLAASGNRNNKNYEDITVLADFVGRFEYYKSSEGVTIDGLRFRFVVEDIKNIKRISPIKSTKLK